VDAACKLACIEPYVVEQNNFLWIRYSNKEGWGVVWHLVTKEIGEGEWRGLAEERKLNSPQKWNSKIVFCCLALVLKKNEKNYQQGSTLNLVPRVSHLTAPWSEWRETLVGHVARRNGNYQLSGVVWLCYSIFRGHRSAWFPLLSARRFSEFDTSVICHAVLILCLGSFLLQDMF